MPLQQNKLTVSWAALAGALPVDRRRWSFSFLQNWSYLKYCIQHKRDKDILERIQWRASVSGQSISLPRKSQECWGIQLGEEKAQRRRSAPHHQPSLSLLIALQNSNANDALLRHSHPVNAENFCKTLIQFMDTLNIFQPFSTVSKNFYSGHKVSFIFIELLNITLLIYFKYISERCGENSASCGKVHLEGKHTTEIHRRLSIPCPLSLEEKNRTVRYLRSSVWTTIREF